VHGTETKNMEH